jgi:hypothetical protein
MPELDDAALERRLRGVLKEHLGALPLDLTVDALDRRREVKGLARRSARGRRITLLAAAALLLVGGAVAVGSGLVRLPYVVPPVPGPTLPVAVASPSPAAETPGPVVSPSPAASPAGRPWMTGRELMDALSAEYGYQWSPLVINTSQGFRSGPVDVLPPIDGPAKVKVAGGVDDTAEVAQHAGRVAQVLAPDVAPWIQDAIARGPDAYTQGLDAGDRVSTATGGRVDVGYVDEAVIGDWMHFSFVPDPPPTRALEPGVSGIVLYPVYSGGDPSGASVRIWAVNPDGTDAGLFIPSTTTPDGVEDVIGWSADGSRLFYGRGRGVFVVDADGSQAVRVGARRDNPLCPVVVADDNCEASDDISVSPDGMRLAYKFEEGRGLDNSAIAILDVASGQVTRLGSTDGDDPSWSPDGTRLVFGCGPIGPVADGICLVNLDGSGLRQILPAIAGDVSDPQWSPDGSSILFKVDGNGRAELFTIGPDGAGLRSLTSDRPDFAHWTRDGRIVFIRRERGATGRGDLWIMDADGNNATTLDTTVAAQTAAGCLVCHFLGDQDLYDSGGDRIWQPMLEGQP